MAKKTIAVDIDDVLADSAAEFVAYSNKQWGTNLHVDDYHEDWALMWQVDRLTERQRALEIYDAKLFMSFSHDPDAHEVLKKLSKTYELVIATSRVYKVHQDTLNWLNKHYEGIFSGVHFSGIYDTIATGPLKDEGMHTLTKQQLCKEIGADYLIDDQPKHCIAVAEAGIESILFGDYAWSRDIDTLPDGVSRCHNWSEVEKFFDARR